MRDGCSSNAVCACRGRVIVIVDTTVRHHELCMCDRYWHSGCHCMTRALVLDGRRTVPRGPNRRILATCTSVPPDRRRKGWVFASGALACTAASVTPSPPQPP
eukprot:m.4155 g.4155  ORF g.4155 m.4155 type:complete len:103 (-) comp3364_c0_seq1:109-417(-)